MSLNSPSVSSIEGYRQTNRNGSNGMSGKTNERIFTLQSYSSDPKYKKYVQQVEKCLNSFDNVHEWADCIAFLKQLLKTFQSYMQFKEIPKKLIVSKRLAQCLNPGLPTGVHQRALEVYVHILAVLGPEGFQPDLSLWSSGLFPFFEYSATSVKPTLLNIYDTHYLPLQSGLRPVMKSFILALLPGLEEETGEFFEKVLGLLDRISGAVSISFFFQNIWLIMLTTPSARATSLNFLSRRLPRLNNDEDITDVVGKDIGLMIRAFAAALEDDNLLVRRAALDILLQSLKVDSHTIQKAQKEDRAILMRAATGVVLRRDLSLNRRLNTWLLGVDEKSEAQTLYLQKNVLELLSSTLKLEMFSPSGEYAESRPFKIFISLLDKWEIGAPLTEAIVYDSFRAIMQLMQNPSESGEDLSMTASTLYEAVEPQVLWKHLLSRTLNIFNGDNLSLEAVNVTRFILKSFSHEEEVQTIHLPVMLLALIDLLSARLSANNALIYSKPVLETLKLIDTILQHTPHAALLQRPPLTSVQSPAELRPLDFACAFFKISDIVSPPTDLPLISSVPLESCFYCLISISRHYANCSSERSPDISSLRESFCTVLSILDHVTKNLGSPLTVSWDPSTWLANLMTSFDHEVATFSTVDRVIDLALSLHRNQYIVPKFSINERSIIQKMIEKLISYLQPRFSAYHVRAVHLIWSLESSTKRTHVESILAQSMTSSEAHVGQAYEAFGVLWRLTDDTLQPGFHFRIPMMIVLDSIKSSDPSLRRIGETWMRCSLKSYIRVLDPILYDLLDPGVLRTPTMFKVRGRELPGFVYERAFDQRLTNHLLETLLSIINFGGQGFSKAARTSTIKRSHHPGLIQRVTSSGFIHGEASYLDVLIETLLRLVRSEPKAECSHSMQSMNIRIQSNAIELLQAIITRGEVEPDVIETIEATTIGKLYVSIHTSRLDLQNKWLHLLHSVIAVSTAGNETARLAEHGGSDGTLAQNGDVVPARYPMNPLLIQTLVDGISMKSNRPVLQHWLDFILMAVPQFQPALHAVVAPLNDCLCRQILGSLADVLRATPQGQDYAGDIPLTASDAELIMFLNGLERLILLSLAYTTEPDISDDEQTTSDKPIPESTGLLGYVSNVFSSDSSTVNQADQLSSRSPGYRALDEGIRVLYSLWASLIWKKPEQWSAKDDSLSLTFTRTRTRCRRVLEHLFRVQSTEVFESLVDWWSREQSLSISSPDAVFEMVDVLIANAQNAVQMICESIGSRVLITPEKNKKQTLNPNLTDAVLFKFLEHYLRRLEGPLAIQVWSRYLPLVKDILTTSKEFKVSHFHSLRCIGVLADKITQTAAMEDRKMRKELQDNYGKLLESCVIYVGRSTDQGSWIRRTAKDSVLPSNSGRESPASRQDSLPDKLESSISSLPPDTPRLGGLEAIGQIISFVSSSTLPNIRKILSENDKVITACNNIIYYIVNPAMRGKTRPMDVDGTVIQILVEMTKIPTALKSWRTPVVDLLNDNRLFNCNPTDALKWRPIVNALYDSDKTTFPELLTKVSNAPTTNIFANREYEMLLRSLNLRRLSYVLFTGEKNAFLTQLPTIQEKLVDTFRTIPSPIVQSEVFLCIRVLLCRLSPRNLTSFWPVVLTELYRILEQVIAVIPADGSDDLQLVLAVCKCIDTLLVLQVEEFQVHQWIFVTDTVDAVYRPDDWIPTAMLDRLGEISSSLPVPDKALTDHTEAAVSDQRSMRKPFLASVRQIESMRDLVSFFSNISISTYESVYASRGLVDWEAVEKSIIDDMFDGR